MGDRLCSEYLCLRRHGFYGFGPGLLLDWFTKETEEQESWLGARELQYCFQEPAIVPGNYLLHKY